MEQTLFSIRYERDGVEQRLDRLEEIILGQTHKDQPVEARLANLKSVYALSHPPAPANASSPNEAVLPPLKQQQAVPIATTAPKMEKAGAPRGKTGKVPVKPTTVSPQGTTAQTTFKPPVSTTQAAPVIPGESDYPAVSQMEQRVFGQTYVREDITQRLERLEMKVFGAVRQGELMARVDSLRLPVLGDLGTPASNDEGAYGQPIGNPYAPPGYSPPGYPQQSAVNPYRPHTQFPDPNVGDDDAISSPRIGAPANQADMAAAVTKVEQEVLRQTYPMESVSDRLGRLEVKIFNVKAPPNLSEEERLQRIIAVASADGDKAGPSAKSKTIRGLIPVLIMMLPLLL